jgi:hypothetical protein
MSAAIRIVVLDAHCWHFQCPECGMGDEEIGQLAEHDDIYCEVCLEESERHVRLHRWPADAGGAEEGGDEMPLTRTAA